MILRISNWADVARRFVAGEKNIQCDARWDSLPDEGVQVLVNENGQFRVVWILEVDGKPRWEDEQGDEYPVDHFKEWQEIRWRE